MARTRALVAALLVTVCALAGCAATSATRVGERSSGMGGVPSTVARPSVTTVAPTTAGPPAFVGTVSTVTAADLPYTYRPGCPVAVEDLRMLHLSYWGFDGEPHVGTMVVKATMIQDVLTVFSTLYDDRFPIRQMVPEDAFQGSDPASMDADNTSGFNCRYAVAPGPPQWSAHAYGEAIDVNTVENPYVEGASVQPAAGAAYLDRSVARPGMAIAGGPLVTAFASVGWLWGGRWTDAPDYQHFSKTGG
jgi:hypothetical protein